VKIAHDGQSGMDHLLKFKPDLIMLDVFLPDANTRISALWPAAQNRPDQNDADHDEPAPRGLTPSR
jgi:response regulator of citrate/malate metabolism